jgi:hypothetical protein
MTDIPEMYLAEAVRRLNASGYYYDRVDHAPIVFARALQELGWTPPIDEARMAKAEKVVSAIGRLICPTRSASVKAAYDALGED